MILKHKDDVAPLLAELERLSRIPSLTPWQREQLDQEDRMIRAGARGEKEAAYHINFHWKNGTNSVVLHDLRIEHDGRVAQIDHLILHRRLDFHVIESKNFGREVRISESGEWEMRAYKGWMGIPSPIEQNRRHIEVLSAFIRDRQLAPKRLGLALPLYFHNWVLVAPECPLRREGAEWNQVVKMDMFDKQFVKKIDQEGVLDTLAAMSRFVALETIENIARALLAAHRPATFRGREKFGIARAEVPQDDSRFAPPDDSCFAPRGASSSDSLDPSRLASQDAPRAALPPVHCAKCAAILEDKVIRYCRLNAAKFGGQMLCQPCQKTTTAALARPACDTCGAELEDKVIAFCRFNARRLGGRMLCRICQPQP